MEEPSKPKTSRPAAPASATPAENLVLSNVTTRNTSAVMIDRIKQQLPERPLPTSPRAMRVPAIPRIQVGTDVLDFMSFPENPHALITDHLRQVGRLLPQVKSEHAGVPMWDKFVLHEALKVVNATCPSDLRRSALKRSRGVAAKCHLLASLIPARYFPESGTVVDRFFAGLISFLGREYRFTGQHAVGIGPQQESSAAISTPTSNAARKWTRSDESNSQSRRRKPRLGPKVSPHTSMPLLSDVFKQEATTTEHNPQTPSMNKRERRAEISSENVVQASRKRKSLDGETPIGGYKEETASTEDPSPSKKKKKTKVDRRAIEPSPLSPDAALPLRGPRMIIKLEDSSDEGPETAPRPRKKRLNVYESMYHKAQEDIRFFERFLWHGAGISKTDINASKTRVAMGQTHKQAFDRVHKPPRKKLESRPRQPRQQ
ncbi:hypothetical protein AYO21_00397 [Fonsecaea monophora]|uniref:Uncharacterized protein n=1 Tax=Fonsecaea monophora TaxID=254056 RepID=A0A177FPE7_9EURO|nr:hypothetical protein AYO21_00397 [Fonsecaea monophora]KAH0828468.1 hypothetical protein FOPE_01583 [Fonsecaea pedrosoi]OAG45049.1 hypothetical protein AYO21_00397 [Fonsecaea monophora]